MARLMVGLAILALVALAVSAVQLADQNRSSRGELRIFAAASLTFAFEDMKDEFEQKYDVRILYNFAGSNSLAAQIVQGSPSDIYVSADVREMARVRNAGLLKDDRFIVPFYNILTVVTPADNPEKIDSLDDLAGDKVRVVMADEDVPAGRYTHLILQKIDATWGNRSSIMYQGPLYRQYSERVLKNVISFEPDVQQVVQKVVMGIADAGFVYRSDAAAQDGRVYIVPIPEEVNVVATYGIGVITTSKSPTSAQSFVDYVLSDRGKEIMKKWGFILSDDQEVGR